MAKRERAPVDLVAYAHVCLHGTADELAAFIDEHDADVNEPSLCTGNNIRALTPLMVACARECGCHVVDVVEFLLSRRAVASAVNVDGYSALAFACAANHLGVVQRLLPMCRGIVNTPRIADGRTPLFFAAMRSGLICAALLDAGAIMTHTDGHGRTALFDAIGKNCIDAAKVLIARGASVNVQSIDERTPLMWAVVKGGNDAVEWCSLLLGAGADVELLDKHRRNALTIALLSNNAQAARQLLKRYEELGVKPVVLRHHAGVQIRTDGEPLECMRIADQCSERVLSPDALRGLFSKVPALTDVPWMFLRARVPQHKGEAFELLVKHKGTDPRMWYWLACELRSTRHGSDYETLLHVACRSPDADIAVPQLMRVMVNPLLHDRHGRLALDHLVPKSPLRATLAAYMLWRPTVEHMRWWGPFFAKRVFTWLLVHRRLRPRLPRDVSHRIIQWLARGECVSI